MRLSQWLQVSVRILGGLMALGYQIGTIMKRTSTVFSDDRLTIKARAAQPCLQRRPRLRILSS